jgi:MoaA/NifB/PqqE/SkfB family radical SAM enzyme
MLEIRKTGSFFKIKSFLVKVRRRILTRFGAEKIPLPNFEIEVSTACNLKCPMCSRTVGVNEKNWSAKNMSFEFFKTIFEKLPNMKNLNCYGQGEPTMNPSLPRILKYVRETGKVKRQIRMTSNGLFKTSDYYTKLFESGLDYLTISVDSLDQPTADIVRRGTDVEKLKVFLKEIIAEHASKMNINIVVGKSNHPSIEQVLRYISSVLPNDQELKVKISTYGDWGSDAECLNLAELGTLSEELVAWRDKFPSLIFRTSFHRKIASYHQCHWARDTFAIHPDGILIACTNSMYRPGSKESFDFANVSEKSFLKLANFTASKALSFQPA